MTNVCPLQRAAKEKTPMHAPLESLSLQSRLTYPRKLLLLEPNGQTTGVTLGHRNVIRPV